MTRTGVCVITPAKTTVYALETAPKKEGARLSFIYDTLMQIIEAHTPITQAVLESGSYGGSGRLFQLGGPFAIAQLACTKVGIPLSSATPMQIKKFFAANHKAGKPEMLEAANALFPAAKFVAEEEDEIDAFACALLAIALRHPRQVRRRHALEVAVKLAKHDVTWTHVPLPSH